MNCKSPIEVAVIGGGCAAMASAFELTRPEHRGKYHVTVYQLGWRLGGKGASGRGPADRIEEHGLHVWMGFYENAFRLLRECYAELGDDAKNRRFKDWEDAFFPDPFVGVTDLGRNGRWLQRTACFPAAKGLPGDPLTDENPFSITSYLSHTAALLRTLLLGVETRDGLSAYAPSASSGEQGAWQENDVGNFETSSSDVILARITRLVKYGLLSTTAGSIEAVGILQVIFKSLPTYSENVVLRVLEGIASNARHQLEKVVEQDEDMRYKWEIIDLVVAIMVGIIRFGLINNPKGFDAINDYECLEWLKLNGASERSVKSAFVRGLYDLAFAYGEGGDPRPGLAAGQAVRGSLRMLFTYRGAIFWKMRAGMGDVVFAPFYEVLKKRGVTFKFFHRLENLKIADSAKLAPGERPYVEALEFHVQARTKRGSEYKPLIDVRGLPCWPSKPDYSQLVNGKRIAKENWDFESHWDRRKSSTKTLRVIDDFDFVVLGVGMGAVPYVCSEIIERDARWRDMVEHVKTGATQAFQIWLREGMESLGWTDPPVNISGYVEPFNTWADMRQLIPEESWSIQPGAIAYFCNALPDPPEPPDRADTEYPARRLDEVRHNAIRFLNRDIQQLWPKATHDSGGFRWELLADPAEADPASDASVHDENRFDSQYWTANVNPSDRYVFAPPGSLKYRISPLDNTYDNLTIAGDWTDCGFNEGCVEAAVMSGRLAAHAISESPPLEEIIGYDHP